MALTVAIGSITFADTGTTSHEIVSWDAGRLDAENKTAESSFVDGSVLTSTRTRAVSMTLVARITGTSLADLQAKIDALAAVVAAWSYTVTETVGSAKSYDAMPASWQRAYDPVLLGIYADRVTLSIPRQPLDVGGS